MPSSDRRASASLLERFGADESLIGDLIEQQRAGRSRLWVWRQLAGALLGAVVRDIVDHPVRLAFALLLAFVLRYVALALWTTFEPRIDLAIGGVVGDVIPLSRVLSVIVVGCANAILITPVWFAIGFVVGRSSRSASLLFVGVALAIMMPHVARQLGPAIAFERFRWLLPVQLVLFGTWIGSFALSTLAGAVCALRDGHELA